MDSDSFFKLLPILTSGIVAVAGLGAAWGTMRTSSRHHKESISAIRDDIQPMVEASRETALLARTALNTANKAHTRLDVLSGQVHFLDNERTRHWERIITMPLRITQRIPGTDISPAADDSHQMPQPIRSSED